MKMIFLAFPSSLPQVSYVPITLLSLYVYGFPYLGTFLIYPGLPFEVRRDAMTPVKTSHAL